MSFNQFNSFKSLEELQDSKHLIPANNEDVRAIEEAFDNDLELSFDDFKRVWTEGDTYIADLKEWL